MKIPPSDTAWGVPNFRVTGFGVGVATGGVVAAGAGGLVGAAATDGAAAGAAAVDAAAGALVGVGVGAAAGAQAAITAIKITKLTGIPTLRQIDIMLPPSSLFALFRLWWSVIE